MNLVNYDEAAKFLNVAKGTLYGWVHSKWIPHVRLSPRVVRFDLDELAQWARSPKPTQGGDAV
jgi:excisionase family DNA binding protein